MPVFASYPVIVVRDAGTPHEERWGTRMGGDFATQALFYRADPVVTGDEIRCDRFDEPRVVVAVKPVLVQEGVSHWEAVLMPRSEWNSHRENDKSGAAPRPGLADGQSGPQVPGPGAQSSREQAGRMSDVQFSSQHKAQFKELLATGLELYAINRHPERLDFGPWLVRCEQGDSDTKVRLKSRFRAAARKAASASGAPCRVNRLDWWISKLARGQKLPFIQGLIQRSAEYCEELESNALELRPLVQETDARPGLSRDRYPCDHPVPYWLYDEPHRALPEAPQEFAFWDRHIWEGFSAAVEQIGKEPGKKRRWVDETGNQHCLAKEEIRRRVIDQVEDRTRLLDAWILGASYDVAVLQANYVIDRGLRAEVAMRAFEDESAELIEKVRLAWRKSSKRLGLSWQKQEKRGVDLAKPFREVGADLRHLASTVLAVDGGVRQITAEPSPFTSVAMTPEEHLSVDEEEGWVRVQRADWREDAVYALKAPAFLRPVETARLDAIATLRKEAAAAAQSVLPSTTQQLEICLWPAFSKYAEDVFDKMAEARLGVSGRGGPRAYRRWLRSKCLSAVVDDVCRPVLGQFPITIRHVVEIIGERQSPEIERTRRALRGMLTEVIGGPFTENLNRCLTAHLEGRGPYWEARAARPLPATTANDVNRMNRGAEAYHQGEHKTPAEIDPTHAIAERAGRRQAVVMPILAKKRWKRGRLATEAGVGKNSVYQYLDGTRVKITKENRRALAEALELASEQLPA